MGDFWEGVCGFGWKEFIVFVYILSIGIGYVIIYRCKGNGKRYFGLDCCLLVMILYFGGNMNFVDRGYYYSDGLVFFEYL